MLINPSAMMRQKARLLLSRGAAAECSPGQRPGIRCVLKMSHGVAKETLGIFRTYRCSCLPRAQPRALPGARLCRRSAALVGRRLMRNYFGQHCLEGGDKKIQHYSGSSPTINVGQQSREAVVQGCNRQSRSAAKDSFAPTRASFSKRH